MKPKTTRTGLLNEISKDFMPISNSTSGSDDSLPTHNQFKFTDLYLSDSRGDHLPVSGVKTEIVRSDIDAAPRKINFRITILSFKGFFKGFYLWIGYTKANGAIHEKHYSINDTLLVAADLQLSDIKDLTQVCISVRSKRGIALKISMSNDGLATSEELKIDVTSVNDITLFVNNYSKDKNETQMPIGWISYNTPNIFY